MELGKMSNKITGSPQMGKIPSESGLRSAELRLTAEGEALA